MGEFWIYCARSPNKKHQFLLRVYFNTSLRTFFFAQSPPNNMGPYIQNKPHNFIKVWSFVKFSMFDLFCFWNPSIGDYNIFLGVTWFYFPKLAMLSALLRHPCVVFDLAMDGSGDVTLVSMWKWLEKRGGCTMFCVCVCAESSAELVLVYRASRLGWLSLVTGHHGRVVCFKNGTKEYCTMMCPRKGCLGTVFWVCTCQSYVGAISSYEYDSDVHNLTSILPYVLKSLMLWRCFVLEKKWSLCLVGPREFPNRNRAFEFGINSHMAVAKKLNHGTLQRTLQERYIYVYIYVHINLYLYYNDKIKYDRLLGGYQI